MPMQISASGVLLRAAYRLEHTRDAKHLSHPLRTLYSHLRELRERHHTGDALDRADALNEFFAIWTQFETAVEL